MNSSGFISDLRAVLFPANRWHWLFHLVVLVSALAYWVGAWIKWPEASWAELIMYRPGGDNQVWPIITALSKGNLGDPTDALHYGTGVGGFQVVVLLPHALAYALFGGAGYMVADALLSWLYFLAVTLFLRRCRLGLLPSLLLGAGLASGGLQAMAGKAGQAFVAMASVYGGEVWDWGFPNLFDLPLFPKRLPRPMVTEIFLVLALYFLVRQWLEPRPPSLRHGVALGASLAVVAQGDPYALAAAGLVLLVALGRMLRANHWRVPWRLGAGLMLGAAGAGWYFLYQRLHDSAEASVRFGLASYARSQMWFLPGYAPLVRVLVVVLAAAALIWLVRVGGRVAPGAPSAGKGSNDDHGDGAADRALAWFCVVLVVCAWLAQPAQMFLLGKGAQIYHYMMFTLPAFYGYALLVLVASMLRRVVRVEMGGEPVWRPRLAGAGVAALLGLILLFGLEGPITWVGTKTNSRQESDVPWASLGERYRPNFRALDRAFREVPALREARTFATMCHEINFLLAGFHDKRAFVPDNAYSTLSDAELEVRLMEYLKIIGLSPQDFETFVSATVVLNYWLGCAKYWFATDHKYGREDDYKPEDLAALQRQPPQQGWWLVLPQSEIRRLRRQYEEQVAKPSSLQLCPDVIILTTVERRMGLQPMGPYYVEAYTNEAFLVYAKNMEAMPPGDGAGKPPEPGPAPPP